MKTNPFLGRTISVVNDLSFDEQLYLYEKTRELKEKIMKGADVESFKIKDKNAQVYLMFLEDSTRTKESFRNAACFHGLRVHDFDAATSSFNKKESMTDTVKMLAGYASSSIFIMRTKQEGVCRMLQENIGAYTKAAGFPTASFINAGDGKHEHPTQEFLDEFSFLEQLEWKRDKLHIALTGDLYHGRTVHSKADGMKIFKEVMVDLIAPKELAMPEHYVQKMKDNGFIIREFESIDAYLQEASIAPIWYFTRLQLERMGEAVLEKADSLRASLTFRKDMLDKIPEGVRFYHPLPRDRTNPTNPVWLDNTSLNGWDRQSVNGYYTRIMEIALLGGAIGTDFTGKGRSEEAYPDDFVTEATFKAKEKPECKVGIKPVENGIVIDHIASGKNLDEIWHQIDKIRRIMKLNVRSSHGVYHSNTGGFKGIISLPDILDLSEKDLKKLGAIAPGCTLNLIKNHTVVKKFRMRMPPRIYNFEEISCKNDACISHPSHVEHVIPEFIRSNEDTFICSYCEKPHSFSEIWDV